MKETYEDTVQECSETRRDLDVVLHPTFKHLKKAFSLIFAGDGMNGTDFKRLSDFTYYQGGYPSPDSPAKESSLAFQIANVMRLEELLEKRNFSSYLGAEGVSVEYVKRPGEDYFISDDDLSKLTEAWQGGGIDSEIPAKKSEALKLLLERAQSLQSEICQTADTIKDTGVEVEDKFKIKKGNFIKAVGLAALRLKKGDGAMGEKVDDAIDNAENLIAAVQPLLPRSK